jgi:hypothetical protein
MFKVVSFFTVQLYAARIEINAYASRSSQSNGARNDGVGWYEVKVIGDVLPPLDSDEETVTGHPLVALYAGLARGIFPPWDGLTEVMPRPPDRFAAVLAFSGHCLVAADVDAAWVTSRCPRNVSSLRAILAGGFLPVGTEVLFPR